MQEEGHRPHRLSAPQHPRQQVNTLSAVEVETFQHVYSLLNLTNQRAALTLSTNQSLIIFLIILISLFTRILESMGQQQQSPRPVIPTPVKNVSGPTLPLPRRPPSIVKTPVITPPVITPPVISPSLLSPTRAETPSIPGNHQTNPFLDLIDASSYYDQQMELCSKMSKSQIHHTPSSAVAPPRPPSSLTPSSSLISSSGPPLPNRNKVQSRQDNVVSDSTKEWQLSPRAILDPPRSSPSMSSITPTSSSQMFRAVFEYAAVQKDELSLRRGELYTVTERCHDGWCKARTVKRDRG